MLFFNKSKPIFLFILLLIPTNIFLKTDITLSTIEKTIDEVEKTGEKTINFLKTLELKIPEIICQMKEAKGINAEFVTAFLEHYGEYLTLKEILKLRDITKKETMTNRLSQLMLYVAIESLLIACQSNIEKKKIYMPLKKSDDYKEKTKKIEILTKKIDNYLKKIKTSIKQIRHALSLSIEWSEDCLKLSEKSLSKIESQKISDKENQVLNSLIEAFEYKSLLEILEITKEKLVKKFKTSLKKAFKYFLNEDGIKTLEKLTEDSAFKTIKTYTTKETFLSLASRVFDAFEKSSTSTVELLSECKKLIF